MCWYLALGHLQSSAGWAVGSPSAGKASSVTLLAAGIFCRDSTLGQSMWAAVSPIDGISATDQCDFARDVL